MWPSDNLLGKGIFNNHIPDCRNGGAHRWGNIHFMSKSRDTVIRVCRYCQAEIIRKLDIIDGKLVETILKSSSQSNQIDKSTTNNDVKNV